MTIAFGIALAGLVQNKYDEETFYFQHGRIIDNLFYDCLFQFKKSTTRGYKG